MITQSCRITKKSGLEPIQVVMSVMRMLIEVMTQVMMSVVRMLIQVMRQVMMAELRMRVQAVC